MDGRSSAPPVGHGAALELHCGMRSTQHPRPRKAGGWWRRAAEVEDRLATPYNERVDANRSSMRRDSDGLTPKMKELRLIYRNALRPRVPWRRWPEKTCPATGCATDL